MVFSTIIFLFRFLPITLALYYLAPAKLKNTVLFLCSLVFYCWGEVRFFPVMVALILINYISGLCIEHFDQKPALRRAFLLVALIGSLGMLFYFKYANFVLRSANALLGTAFAEIQGIGTLPLGISFYTFQTLSYSIDVYRRDVKAERNIIDFGAYVVMFPQLIAGPIVKYRDVSNQLHVYRHRYSLQQIEEGMTLFTFGLAKKVLLADAIGALWTDIIGVADSENRTLPKNTAAVEALCQRHPGKVDVLLAPAASVIYPENVPANAPLLDEDAYLDQLSAAVQAAGGRFVDVRQTLAEHKDEYIYYRTDHHWTSLGAYYAYQQLCGTLSLTPFDPAAHTALTAENFYGTHYSKARTWNAVPDTITYYDLPNSLTIYNVTAAGQPADGQTTGLYDTDKLNVYDKYAMFLHGNNGLSRIEGDGTGRILVIKDSYANCFAPYLTANYAQIDVVDFRNYNYGLDQLIADNDYDQILVLYSFDSFKSDPYLYRAGVAG